MLSSPRRNLAESVYRDLKQAILVGRLRPGQQLSERELADSFGASRTPIRHALTRLQAEGFLSPNGHIGHNRSRGYVISSMGLDDVSEILYLRTLLEGAAAELAAPNITDHEVQHLERMAAEDSYVSGDPARYAKFIRDNREFHLGIARASRNRRLEVWIGNLLDEMERVISASVTLSNRFSDMQRGHREIVNALRQRDPGAAKRAAENAMEDSRQRIAEAVGLLRAQRR